MDYEKKYKEALLEARAVLEPCLKYSRGKVREALDSIDNELKRFESEDEGIRKLLVWQVYRNIEDETNDLAQSVYDGIKGHDPDIEESIEDWKRCLAWLEKQKQQKPAEWSEEDEEMIKTIISVLERSSQVTTYEQRGGLMSGSVGCSDKYKEEIAWLKSLRPSWKPSEHQMNILKAVKEYVGKGSGYWGEALGSLIEDLEKL